MKEATATAETPEGPSETLEPTTGSRMRDEERRYDEASQLCRAAEDLRSRVESLRSRLGEGAPHGGGDEIEGAEEAAVEALRHLRRYRETLVGGSREEVSAG